MTYRHTAINEGISELAVCLPVKSVGCVQLQSIFLSILANNTDYQNTTVSNTSMCLVVTKNCGIITSVSLKTCYF
jgi:hypothetical protein